MLEKRIPEQETAVRGMVHHQLGRQLAIDFYDCGPDRLLDPDQIKTIFIQAAKDSGATVVDASFHTFKPQGVSGVVVIAESHFAVHAWPEYNYAAVDIFTCGEGIDLEKAIASLKTSLQAGQVTISADNARGLIDENSISAFTETSADVIAHPALSWRHRYEKKNPWGMQTAIDIYDCDPQRIRDAEAIRQFVYALCDKIRMKRFGDCHIVNFGEDARVAGYSMMQLIETSLISGHFANAANTAYLDIFSCKYYDPRKVAEFATDAFKGRHYKLQLNFRQ